MSHDLKHIIAYARKQLELHYGDLDCAGWGLQELLKVDPGNSEAQLLLTHVISAIDECFDKGNTLSIFCHIALGRESPSPYVRAIEGRESEGRSNSEAETR